jgi:hypothetical protein
MPRAMADWVTISSLATAGGTLVLAVATFSSVRSANRAARAAESSLLVGTRPILIPSREDDPRQRVGFGDQQVLSVPGHGAAAEVRDGRIYLAIGLRNGGAGLAVIHGWQARAAAIGANDEMPSPDAFRRQQRDLYIPPGELGFWQGAIRDPADDNYDGLRSAIGGRERITVDLLYGDQFGGQRTIVRIGITHWEDVEGERAEVVRYWNVDGPQPR